MLYVDDLAEAVLRWLDHGHDGRRPFELHDGKSGGYTWEEVMDTAARLRGGAVIPLPVPSLVLRLLAALNLMAASIAGYAPMLTPGKVRELRHTDWVCDNEPFHHETGWVPEVCLEEGLRRTLHWRR
jgi:nucleoside-diphosphate-sugar epimerase